MQYLVFSSLMIVDILYLDLYKAFNILTHSILIAKLVR